MFSGAIVEVLRGCVSPEGGAWLTEASAEVSRDSGRLVGAWNAAARRLGRAVIAPTEAQRKALAAAGSFVPDGWGADECGRALLLLAGLAAVPAGEQVGLVEELYRTGEIRERQAVLRVLAYLPEPARFVPLAIESVRANVLSELEAIACENPFPKRHFPEGPFNQLVLKSLFNGISLGRIEGLGERCVPELVRMVTAYASERRAAGRVVPDDVTLVLDGGS